jgi:predicted dinucleotide-binding enzyme
MQVTIIGTGNMARGIGSRVLAGGYDLTVVGKDFERAEAVAADIAGAGTVKTAVSGDPIEGHVVVLAVYYPDALGAAEQYADQLAGKVVVDTTNPVNESFDGLVVPPDGSATEELAALAGGACWVKAFNTTFAIPLKSGQSPVTSSTCCSPATTRTRRARSRTGPRRRAQPDRRGPVEARARARGRGPASHGSSERAPHRFRKRSNDPRLTVGSPPAAAPEARA